MKSAGASSKMESHVLGKWIIYLSILDSAPVHDLLVGSRFGYIVYLSLCILSSLEECLLILLLQCTTFTTNLALNFKGYKHSISNTRVHRYNYTSGQEQDDFST